MLHGPHNSIKPLSIVSTCLVTTINLELFKSGSVHRNSVNGRKETLDSTDNTFLCVLSRAAMRLIPYSLWYGPVQGTVRARAILSSSSTFLFQDSDSSLIALLCNGLMLSEDKFKPTCKDPCSFSVDTRKSEPPSDVSEHSLAAAFPWVEPGDNEELYKSKQLEGPLACPPSLLSGEVQDWELWPLFRLDDEVSAHN